MYSLHCANRKPVKDEAETMEKKRHKPGVQAARKPIRTISGVLELISRFEFEFCRRENYFLKRFEFLVCSCECCHGLFVPTQFHFECYGFRDDS